MSIRDVTAISVSKPVLEGAGVRLRRAFGFNDAWRYDPFLLLDDFRGGDPEDYIAGFPWHPHRGIETITYMLEGSVEHGDSIGNQGTIRAGQVQWMTAGRGIIHQEMPRPGQGGRMGGFQLWANLPAKSKMIAPRYQEYSAADFPVAGLGGGASAIVICGEIDGQAGPVSDVEIKPSFFVLTVPAGTTVRLPTPSGHNVLAYVFGGEGFFDVKRDPTAWEILRDGYTERLSHARLGNRTLICFSDGDSLQIEATGSDALQCLIMAGQRLREPIAWGGPIVMNTRAELQTAFQQLEDNTFLDPDPRSPQGS